MSLFVDEVYEVDVWLPGVRGVVFEGFMSLWFMSLSVYPFMSLLVDEG